MNFLREGSALRTKSLWIFGRARWLLATVLFFLGATATFLGLPNLSNQIRSDIPGVRCWFPVPMDESKFTIVMTPFVTVDAKGSVKSDGDGRELARLLYTRLESSFEGLALKVPYELRSPDQSCPVEGATREERAAAAEKMAAAINADIVLYGAIQEGAEPDAASGSNEGAAPAAGNAELQPEFYAAYRGFTTADELVGPHELGRPLLVNLPVQAADLEGVADHPVNARAQALSLIVLGLASYVVDDYQQALDYFTSADQIPNWPESAGKETLYLLMGNAASRLATTKLDSSFVDEALDYFDKALAIDPDYARALAGEGSALYQLALGNLQTRQASQVDTGLLDEAEATLQRAAAMSAPEAAEIGLRTHFGLGQIYLVRTYLKSEGGDWLAQARSQFQSVVDSYVAHGVRDRGIVGHSYARLALIADQFDHKPADAISLYQKAIALVTPHFQGQYQIALGKLYASGKDFENARKAYQSAQSLAELYGDEKLGKEADDQLAKLP